MSEETDCCPESLAGHECHCSCDAELSKAHELIGRLVERGARISNYHDPESHETRKEKSGCSVCNFKEALTEARAYLEKRK